MIYQILFSLKKNEEKILRMSSAAIVIGALRVNSVQFISNLSFYDRESSI